MTTKRTYDQISAEIAKVHRDIAGGQDRRVKQPLLDVLEREQYEAIAAGKVPQNHANYVNARDQERAQVIEAEIARIDAQLPDAPAERKGILQGDRARLVSSLAQYKIVIAAQTGSPVETPVSTIQEAAVATEKPVEAPKAETKPAPVEAPKPVQEVKAEVKVEPKPAPVVAPEAVSVKPAAPVVEVKAEPKVEVKVPAIEAPKEKLVERPAAQSTDTEHKA